MTVNERKRQNRETNKNDTKPEGKKENAGSHELERWECDRREEAKGKGNNLGMMMMKMMNDASHFQCQFLVGLKGALQYVDTETIVES